MTFCTTAVCPIVIACPSTDKSKSQIITFPVLCIFTMGNFLTSHTCLRPYAKPPKRSGFNLKLFASQLLETFLLLTVATGFSSMQCSTSLDRSGSHLNNVGKLLKLDGVAPLNADPHRRSSTNRQNPPLQYNGCNF